MPKISKQLTIKEVNALKEPGMYTVGGATGLYLQIKPSGIKYYVYRFVDRVTKKRSMISIGPAKNFTLAQARDKAIDYHQKVLEGLNPALVRQAERIEAMRQLQQKREEDMAIKHTFRYCADLFITQRAVSGYWRNNERGESVIRGYLRRHINPVIGDIPIARLTPQDVFRVLQPIWQSTTDAAPYSKTIIFHVFRWAKAQGWCSQENPADSNGVLGVLLEPLNPGRKKARNMPALDFNQIPDFFCELIASNDISYRAVAFSILCCLRSKMVRNARWEDVDFKKKTLTVPETNLKTKGRGEHTVYLSKQALDILKDLRVMTDCPWIFPSVRKSKPLTDASLSAVFRRLHAKKIEEDGIGWVDPHLTEKEGKPVVATQHGTARACFKTWARTGQNRSLFDDDAVELCMAHKLKDDYAGAYNRATLEPERRKVMQAWADYCYSKYEK